MLGLDQRNLCGVLGILHRLEDCRHLIKAFMPLPKKRAAGTLSRPSCLSQRRGLKCSVILGGWFSICRFIIIEIIRHVLPWADADPKHSDGD